MVFQPGDNYLIPYFKWTEIKENKMITVEQLRRAGFKVRVGHWRAVPLGNDEVEALLEHPEADNKTKLAPRFGRFYALALEARRNKANGSWYAEFCEQKGGETTVTITGLSGHSYTSSAYCSIKDNYDRKKGVKIALGRAVALYNKFEEVKI